MLVTNLHKTNKNHTIICANTHINKTRVKFGYVGKSSGSR